MDPEQRPQWEMMLSEPLPSQVKAAPTPIQADDEGADFMATMAMHAAQTRRA